MRTNRRMTDITKRHAPPPPPRYIAVWQKVITASFFALLFGFGIYRLATPTPTVSYIENRDLKTMPAFSLKSLFSGSYTKNLEDFYADTFLFRDFFIQAGDTVDLMYKIPLSGVDDVVLANDNVSQDDQDMGGDNAGDDASDAAGAGDSDTGGSDVSDSGPTDAAPDTQDNQPDETGAPGDTSAVLEASPSPEPTDASSLEATDDAPPDMKQSGSYLLTDDAIYKDTTVHPDQYAKLVSALNRLQQALPDNRIIAMVPPQSYAFYAPAQYYSAADDEQKAILDIYSQLDPRIVSIDTYPVLSQHTSEYIYFRTDHHWTALGAYYAYTVFAQKLGLMPQNLSDMPKGVVNEKFLGSYYQQIKGSAKAQLIRKHPDTVEYYTPTVQYTSTAYENTTTTHGKNAPVIMLDKIPNNINYYRTFLGGDYPYMHISTQTLNGRSIMIIKDSYANAFVPYLLAHYQDIYVVDYRDYNESGKQKFKIVDFVQAHNVQDVMAISSFDLTNSSIYMNWLIKAFP